MWHRIIAAGTAGAALVAACAGCRPTPGPPAPAADPSLRGFPDLAGFTAVDPAPYRQVRLKSTVVGFTTPALTCSWPGESGSLRYGVSCTGAIPGLPDTATAEPTACDSVAMPSAPRIEVGVRAYVFVRGSGDCPAPIDGYRLAPGAKLSYGGITCAVTDTDVGCVDPIANHGFVLSPTGSRAF